MQMEASADESVVKVVEGNIEQKGKTVSLKDWILTEVNGAYVSPAEDLEKVAALVESDAEYSLKFEQDIPNTVAVAESLGFQALFPQSGASVLKVRSCHSDQPTKRGVPALATTDCFMVRGIGGSLSLRECQVNTKVQHMLPNVLEPSDHKGLVAWFEWSLVSDK